MNKQNLCESKYFPALFMIIVVGMLIQIFRAGLDFGNWLHAFIN